MKRSTVLLHRINSLIASVHLRAVVWERNAEPHADGRSAHVWDVRRKHAQADQKAFRYPFGIFNVMD